MIETMKTLPLSLDHQSVVLVKGENILSASFCHSEGTFVLFDETKEFVYSGSEEQFHEQYEGYECSSLLALDVVCPDNESFFSLASRALGDAKILTARDFFPVAIAAVEPVKEMMYYEPYYHFPLNRATEGYATLIDTLSAFLPASFIAEYRQKTAPTIELFYLKNGGRHMRLASIEGNGSFLPKAVLPPIS